MNPIPDGPDVQQLDPHVQAGWYIVWCEELARANPAQASRIVRRANYAVGKFLGLPLWQHVDFTAEHTGPMKWENGYTGGHPSARTAFKPIATDHGFISKENDRIGKLLGHKIDYMFIDDPLAPNEGKFEAGGYVEHSMAKADPLPQPFLVNLAPGVIHGPAITGIIGDDNAIRPMTPEEQSRVTEVRVKVIKNKKVKITYGYPLKHGHHHE